MSDETGPGSTYFTKISHEGHLRGVPVKIPTYSIRTYKMEIRKSVGLKVLTKSAVARILGNFERPKLVSQGRHVKASDFCGKSVEKPPCWS